MGVLWGTVAHVGEEGRFGFGGLLERNVDPLLLLQRHRHPPQRATPGSVVRCGVLRRKRSKRCRKRSDRLAHEPVRFVDVGKGTHERDQQDLAREQLCRPDNTHARTREERVSKARHHHLSPVGA